MTSTGIVRAGIGGWTFEPWRGTFFPEKLKHADELGFAARKLPTIEVNGTYYRSQTPATFAKWKSEVPDGFVFSLKAPRFATNRKILSEAGESVARFMASGIAELGDSLGPILWQFANTKKFEPEDFAAFLALLPERAEGIPLRHAVEVRHASFEDPAFVTLARKHGVAVAYAHHATYPEIADVTADFVYARLQRGEDDIPTAYPPKQIDAWAARAEVWAEGGVPDDLPLVAPDDKPERKPRDVFLYVIHEGKVRAPQGAMALMERVPAKARPTVAV
ncbi:hypothetical protein Sa4125_22400 [Aureimonas sp. SA4125]|uniref:DUF72 domain-containing protein n=1 Tax=Aureimonas sp. SA4125 TaxID=2826993 RepID=UPI001CC38D55|nr:DUF72 domain-containing protein [Aureimonas sp. SA4125]BDA84698.1 hypothetical protein Sa4125_22400 [Aureimonas sp. SA4125]